MEVTMYRGTVARTEEIIAGKFCSTVLMHALHHAMEKCVMTDRPYTDIQVAQFIATDPKPQGGKFDVSNPDDPRMAPTVWYRTTQDAPVVRWLNIADIRKLMTPIQKKILTLIAPSLVPRILPDAVDKTPIPEPDYDNREMTVSTTDLYTLGAHLINHGDQISVTWDGPLGQDGQPMDLGIVEQDMKSFAIKMRNFTKRQVHPSGILRTFHYLRTEGANWVFRLTTTSLDAYSIA